MCSASSDPRQALEAANVEAVIVFRTLSLFVTAYGDFRLLKAQEEEEEEEEGRKEEQEQDEVEELRCFSFCRLGFSVFICSAPCALCSWAPWGEGGE